MSTEAKTLSLSALSAAVEKAVQADRHGAMIGTATTAAHPIIMGRWLSGHVDAAQAQEIASRITREVEADRSLERTAGAAPLKLEPAFSWHGGKILVGFAPTEVLSVTE